MKLKYQLSIEMQHGNSTKIYCALIHWHCRSLCNGYRCLFKYFCFLMNFRTSFTSYRENRTVFRPKKCIFCETNFAGEEKIQKKLIFAIFFFQMAKKGSEKLKCNDLFFFHSILPPKKWGKTIESLLTFLKVEISGLLTCVHL